MFHRRNSDGARRKSRNCISEYPENSAGDLFRLLPFEGYVGVLCFLRHPAFELYPSVSGMALCSWIQPLSHETTRQRPPSPDSRAANRAAAVAAGQVVGEQAVPVLRCPTKHLQ